MDSSNSYGHHDDSAAAPRRSAADMMASVNARRSRGGGRSSQTRGGRRSSAGRRSKWSCTSWVITVIAVSIFAFCMILAGVLILLETLGLLRGTSQAVFDDGSPSASPSVSLMPSVSDMPSVTPEPSQTPVAGPTNTPTFAPRTPAPIAPTTQTPPPPPSPTPQPASPTLSSTRFCSLDTVVCANGDRFGQAPRFVLGSQQIICNLPYVLGFPTDDPVLQWKNCENNQTQVIWDGRPFQYQASDLSFRLWANASLTVQNGNDPVWIKDSFRQSQFSTSCLPSPALDCPYLHLQNNGDIQINYVGPDTTFQARLAHDVYFDFYPNAPTTIANIKERNTCAQVFPRLVCLGEHLGSGDAFRLGPNRALCNEDYMFGWNFNGRLELRNCATGVANLSYTVDLLPDTDFYFVLNEDTSIEVTSLTTPLWFRTCDTCPQGLQPRTCLQDPSLSCPYFHLRKTGALVLSYAENDNVTAPKAEQTATRAYSNLFLN